MSHGWSEFLRLPAPSAHAAQVYSELGELSGSVAEYLTSGFEAGEPAVLVATAGHAAAFAGALAARGWGPKRIERAALLTTVDAEETLAAFMVDGRPSAQAFGEVVGGIVDRAGEWFPGRSVRVFGEMVNVLQERGEPAAALELEHLWNLLARTRRFSLLCGYRLDVFDRESQVQLLPHICAAHSHVRPAAEPARLAEAVDRALADVLGADGAEEVRARVGGEMRRDRVPQAGLALMWISANMPTVAQRILDTARRHYGDTAAPARA